MSRLTTLALAAAASVALAPSSMAQAPAEAVVEQLGRIYGERYVDRARAPAVAGMLEANLKAGRYRGLDPEKLAAVLTQDLQALTADKHNSLSWNPERYRSMQQTAGGGAPDAYFLAMMRRANYGLVETRVLPGNIRYLRIDAFFWDIEGAEQAYAQAMRFLKDGDAIVLDLRGVKGGSPMAVNYVISHFLPEGTRLMTYESAEGRQDSVTRGGLPAGSLAGRPLFVLIDRAAASAGEEFALHVRKFKLGELIGETTAGAGNRNDFVPVAPGYVASVSVGRARHATDGSGWEGVGVPADVGSPAAQALAVAELRAHESAAKAGGPYAAEHAWLADGLKAAQQPVQLAADELERFAGVYGERRVWVSGGALFLQRQGGPELKLTPLTEDTFAVASQGSVRVRFAPGRPAASLTILTAGGEATIVPRG